MPIKTKILAVSRDTALVSFLQQKLESEDYEIINTRHSGIQLRHVIEAESPEFIILDIVMPTLDGIGTCLQLRQWTQLPIMMLHQFLYDGFQQWGLEQQLQPPCPIPAPDVRFHTAHKADTPI